MYAKWKMQFPPKSLLEPTSLSLSLFLSLSLSLSARAYY